MRFGAAILLFLIAAPPAFSQSPSLVGAWYGEGRQPVGDIVAQWLVRRSADGTFAIEFRHLRACAPAPIHRETGRWVQDGQRYRTWTDTIAGQRTDPAIVDEYDVLVLTAEEFAARHAGSGTVFRSRRVGEDFSWPLCATSGIYRPLA